MLFFRFKPYFRLLALGLLLSAFYSCTAPDYLLLVEKGKSEYKIVISDTACATVRKSAGQLADYIRKISGCTLPIVTDQLVPSEKEILVGKSSRFKTIEQLPLTDSLGYDGILLFTSAKKLVITGNSGRGTQNAVYAFLEEILGCRMYAPGVEKIPENETIRIPLLNKTVKPCFSFREVHAPGPRDSLYRDWHRLHLKGVNSPRWGMFVHTFNKLVPPDSLFNTHPEYYSLVGGKRIADGQLCLSNPDVLKELLANLRTSMAKDPEATIWSVSQNDTYKNCECPACHRLDSLYGGPPGTLIWFVNQVAEIFPDKTISTLAYQYTRQAPERIVPKPNVNIMLCTIECNRSKPVADDKSFKTDIESWGKLTSNIFLWDYVVQFRNYLDPFPNWRVLQPNLQFFRDNRCKMMFQQGSGGSWSDMLELRQYLIAKLLWNPDVNIDSVMNDFLNGYYEEAGPVLKQYITLMTDSLQASGKNLGIYGFPYDGMHSYLTPALLKQYAMLFDKAEAAVHKKPAILARVRKARLPLDFAILDISLHDVDDELTWLMESGHKRIVREDMLARLDTLVSRSERLGATWTNEQGLTTAMYRELINDYLRKSLDPGLAWTKPVTLEFPASPKYPVGGSGALTDGKRGLPDYNFNWLGFEDSDMTATIDLGEVKPIKTVSADFLQFIQAWIFLPVKVEFSYSADGKVFKGTKTVNATEKPDKTGSFVNTFSAAFWGAKARYIKVHAVSLKKCPDGHPGHGLPAWIFCDEVVVK
jgi:hypothetical protein